MGSIFTKNIELEHKYIDIICQICHEKSDDKYRIANILSENKETRLLLLALYISITKVPLNEDKINIYWLKDILFQHIQEYNKQMPNLFIDPIDYVKYNSEIMRHTIYALKTSIANKEYKVKYDLKQYIEERDRPIHITIEV